MLGDKDFATLTIKFKPIYKTPLANIHKELKIFKIQPDYVLASYADNCTYDIIINGIRVEESSTRYRFHLNKYITDKITSVKIIATPNPSYTDPVHFSADTVDQTTHQTIKSIEGGFLSGKTVVFEDNFNSELPYYPKAWTEGDNLKKDKTKNHRFIRKTWESYFNQRHTTT
ncbi:hypothetical protein CW732_12235 [Olleya sp. Bg11-27]|nr:hypothetical protein CW732_12235 [Olleya sp. Bg11-27]